jgi:hypothetical protein
MMVRHESYLGLILEDVELKDKGKTVVCLNFEFENGLKLIRGLNHGAIFVIKQFSRRPISTCRDRAIFEVE